MRDDAQRLCEPLEADAVGLGQLVLVDKCGHGLFAAAVGDRHALTAQAAGGGGYVDGSVPGSQDQDVIADLALGERFGVGLKDEVQRVPDTRQVFALDAQWHGAAKSDAEEDRVEFSEQRTDNIGRHPLVKAKVHADLPDQFHLRQGELRRDLVSGDTQRVQATRHITGLEDHDVMAFLPQLVSTTQAGRPGADDGYLLAGRRAGLEKPDVLHGGRIAGVTLQPPDLHRRLHQQAIHACPFAQNLGGASAGTTAAEDVGLQDRACGAEVVFVQDLPNEFGDIDVRGAGAGTWGVETVEAARSFDQHFVRR